MHEMQANNDGSLALLPRRVLGDDWIDSLPQYGAHAFVVLFIVSAFALWWVYEQYEIDSKVMKSLKTASGDATLASDLATKLNISISNHQCFKNAFKDLCVRLEAAARALHNLPEYDISNLQWKSVIDQIAERILMRKRFFGLNSLTVSCKLEWSSTKRWRIRHLEWLLDKDASKVMTEHPFPFKPQSVVGGMVVDGQALKDYVNSYFSLLNITEAGLQQLTSLTNASAWQLRFCLVYMEYYEHSVDEFFAELDLENQGCFVKDCLSLFAGVAPIATHILRLCSFTTFSLNSPELPKLLSILKQHELKGRPEYLGTELGPTDFAINFTKQSVLFELRHYGLLEHDADNQWVIRPELLKMQAELLSKEPKQAEYYQQLLNQSRLANSPSVRLHSPRSQKDATVSFSNSVNHDGVTVVML